MLKALSLTQSLKLEFQSCIVKLLEKQYFLEKIILNLFISTNELKYFPYILTELDTDLMRLSLQVSSSQK